MDEKINEEKDEKSIISQIIQKEIYSVNLQSYDIRDVKKKKINNVIWADELSQDIIYKLFILIKGELECMSLFMGRHNKFSYTSQLLLQRFHKNFLKKDNLEEAISKKVKELEEYKFRTSKGLYKKYKKGERRFQDISIDNIIEMIKLLRKRRIDIYKELLKDFKKNREKYLNFMEKQDYTFV